MATIVTQFLSLFHTQEWFYITIVGVPLVGLYKLYHTFYGSTSAADINVMSDDAVGKRGHAVFEHRRSALIMAIGDMAML